MKIGDRVITLSDMPAFYRGEKNKIIPAHSVGILASGKVPRVRLVGDKCQYFYCIDFDLDGKKDRAGYHSHQFKKYEGA